MRRRPSLAVPVAKTTTCAPDDLPGQPVLYRQACDKARDAKFIGGLLDLVELGVCQSRGEDQQILRGMFGQGCWRYCRMPSGRQTCERQPGSASGGRAGLQLSGDMEQQLRLPRCWRPGIADGAELTVVQRELRRRGDAAIARSIPKAALAEIIGLKDQGQLASFRQIVELATLPAHLATWGGRSLSLGLSQAHARADARSGGQGGRHGHQDRVPTAGRQRGGRVSRRASQRGAAP